MMTYCIIDTKIGFIALAGRNGKLLRSTLPKSTREEALGAIREGLDASAVEDEAGFGDLAGRLRAYAEGTSVDFSDVPVDFQAYGPFHRAALHACQLIPRGQVASYRDLARAAGSERACRAVGTAMASNRTPIIIPCHRVIATGGKIGGFSADLEWKRDLLRLEGVDI